MYVYIGFPICVIFIYYGVLFQEKVLPLLLEMCWCLSNGVMCCFLQTASINKEDQKTVKGDTNVGKYCAWKQIFKCKCAILYSSYILNTKEPPTGHVVNFYLQLPYIF